MAEIEPASDELVADAKRNAKDEIAFWGEKTSAGQAARAILAILARLRKAEADNANLTRLWSGYAQLCREHGIEPSSSEVYAAADRAGGGNA